MTRPNIIVSAKKTEKQIEEERQAALEAGHKPKGKANLKDYMELVERVASVEYRRVPQHMVDYHELVSIGAMAIQALIKSKKDKKLNVSYMATAIRWAIRNELRTRYRWYTLKHNKQVEEDTDDDSEKGSGNVREAVYETILSIDGIQDSSDGDSPYDFLKDGSATPDEHLEIVELGRAVKKCIEALPAKERTIMEYRFYRNMQVKDIADAVGLSSSRITRIVQASLDQVRDHLRDLDHYDNVDEI